MKRIFIYLFISVTFFTLFFSSAAAASLGSVINCSCFSFENRVSVNKSCSSSEIHSSIALQTAYNGEAQLSCNEQKSHKRSQATASPAPTRTASVSDFQKFRSTFEVVVALCLFAAIVFYLIFRLVIYIKNRHISK